MHMLFVSLVRWWYGFGWLDQVGLVRVRLDKMADLFSIELLLRTLLKPFRQIDANVARKGSLDVILRGVFDQLFSRIFGMVIRLLMIVVGSVAVFGEGLFGVLRLSLWPLLPFVPFVGVALAVTGWLPWR